MLSGLFSTQAVNRGPSSLQLTIGVVQPNRYIHVKMAWVRVWSRPVGMGGGLGLGLGTGIGVWVWGQKAGVKNIDFRVAADSNLQLLACLHGAELGLEI